MAIKRSFALSTLLLWTVIIALTLSNIVAAWRLADVNDELELNRRRYGHITVTDPAKAYVSRIEDPNESSTTSFRVRVPEGSRYLLHLSDATFGQNGPSANLQPTESISLNGWRDGADAVLSYSILWDKDRPRITVHSETQGYFDYAPLDWDGSETRESWTNDARPQSEYSTDETIKFMWWRDSATGRGFVLWLEPFSVWNDRRLTAEREAESTKTKPVDASE